MNILNATINKGVPVNTPIVLKATDLYAICSNSKEIEKILTKNFDEYMNYLKRLTPTQDIEFFYTLGVTTDNETLEKKLCFSPSGFISSIFVNLNILNDGSKLKEILMVDENSIVSWLDKKTRNQLELLGTISTPQQLKDEFPSLYIKYYQQNLIAQGQYKILKQIKTNKHLSKSSRKEYKKELLRLLRYIGFNNEKELEQSNGILPVNNFCSRYQQTLKGLIDNSDRIVRYLLSTPIELKNISEEDSEKIALYVATQFFVYCKELEGEEKQRYMYHITSYFNENEKRKYDDTTQISIGNIDNKAIGIKDSGIDMTPKKLYESYKNILINNPELHIIDFDLVDFNGMTLNEVEEFMDEYLKDLKANWVLIPAGEISEDFVPRFLGERNYLSDEERKLKEEKLQELYMAKKAFYDATDPFYRIIGKNTFTGYIGHIYTNGKVVLDKFFDNETTGRVANGQAIYIMNISDFYRLSNLPKQELIHNPLCKRIYHTNDWQTRVTDMINDTTTIKTASELRKLIQSGTVS